MPKSQIHIDDKFLQEQLKDIKSEMSWRRNWNSDCLQFLLVFYPVIGTAMVTLFRVMSAQLCFGS